MEEAQPLQPTDVQPQFAKPSFEQNLQGPTDVLKEGQTVNFQCRVLPNNDPKLKVEWFFNGQPLAQASRCKFLNEFGFISLDLLYVNPEDSGKYTVRVTNEAGQAESSFDIHCKGDDFSHSLLFL